MLAALLNNQTVALGAAAPPAPTTRRRDLGRLMIPINTVFNRLIDLVDVDGAPVLGATLTITLSKDGGAFAGIAPTVTERGNGAYVLALTAAHNDTMGAHTKYVTAPGAVAQFVYDQVVLNPLEDLIEGSVTLRQSQRLQNAAAAGKVSGMGTNAVAVRDLADSKDRIAAAVDVVGNRTAVTRDLT